MAGLWRMVIAVMFAFHLTVGCCAHHAHACEGFAHSPAGADHSGHGGGSESTSGCRDHGQHGPHDCQGDQCSVVLRSQADSASFCLPLQVAFVLLAGEQPSRIGFQAEQLSLASSRLLLPVRLHLANQVLLI